MISPSLLLAITWMLKIGPVTSSPVIPDKSIEGNLRDGRFLKISPKPCQGQEGDWGICMFNYECSRKKGIVLATCVDGFLFGACCRVDMTSAIASVVSSTANILRPNIPVDTTLVPEIDNSLSGVVSPQDIAALQQKVQSLQASGNLFADQLVDTELPILIPVTEPSESEINNLIPFVPNQIKLDEAPVVTQSHLVINGELEPVNKLHKPNVNNGTVIFSDLTERTNVTVLNSSATTHSTSDFNATSALSNSSTTASSVKTQPVSSSPAPEPSEVKTPQPTTAKLTTPSTPSTTSVSKTSVTTTTTTTTTPIPTTTTSVAPSTSVQTTTLPTTATTQTTTTLPSTSIKTTQTTPPPTTTTTQVTTVTVITSTIPRTVTTQTTTPLNYINTTQATPTPSTFSSSVPNLTPEEVSAWTGGLITWTMSDSATPSTEHTWTVKVSVDNDLAGESVDVAVVKPGSDVESDISSNIDSFSGNNTISDLIGPNIDSFSGNNTIGNLIGPKPVKESKPPSTENVLNSKLPETMKPADLLQYFVSNPPEWVIEELLSELGGNKHPGKPVAIIGNELIRDAATTKTTTTTTVATTKATTEPDVSRWDYKKDCGVQPLFRQAKIVGGKQASYGRFPWQVLIRESSWFGIFTKNKCGGVLIGDKWVLSAAHCQPGFLSQLVVLLGEHDISNNGERISAEMRNVKRVIRHKDYVERTFENDLALLELETPITRKPNIVPICLPQFGSGLYEGDSAIVSGWGKLSVSGPTPSVLQEVDVPIMTNQECHDMFKKAGHTKKVLDSFMCAGYPDGLKDSCEGDSGGPLQRQGEDGRWVLVGTVSHGIKCAYPNLPGVYMRMTHYKPWISKVTGLNL